MPHAASGTHAESNQPEMKPVWVLITDEKEPSQSEIGKAFKSMQSRYKDKLRFIKLDWNSEEGKEAAAQAGLKKPPVSVLLDDEGNLVEKFEGSRSSKEIRKLLEKVIKK